MATLLQKYNKELRRQMEGEDVKKKVKAPLENDPMQKFRDEVLNTVSALSCFPFILMIHSGWRNFGSHYISIPRNSFIVSSLAFEYQFENTM